VTQPTPALVAQRAAERLPRLALLLFCAAYILPGLFGRDPWRSADLTAFGYMADLARGGDWFAPKIAGVTGDGALLPYWMGAGAIHLLSPLLDPALAARLPFALLLVGVLVLTWYGCYHLARTDAAQPLPFAFGGEAHPVDYARAIADGAPLALTASFGLLQLGHETTPELAQLAAVATTQWAMAVAAFHPMRARVAILFALPALACSGAPSVAAVLGVAGAAICLHSASPQVRRFGAWVVAATVLACASAWLLDQWAWRTAPLTTRGVLHVARQWLWFLWPAWLLALWALWQWRHHLMRRHLSIPLAVLMTGLLACLAMGGSDRALLLGLPGVAVLAAFALPTLRRSTGSAIDWFSVFFFSLLALAVWLVYIAMQAGVPAKVAANVAKLAPGFQSQFGWLSLVIAVAASAAWLWVVRWRTARHRAAFWRSLVLPAGGVVLAWNLAMTLWLPPLNYARSYRAHVELLKRHIPADVCIAAPALPRALTAALEYHGRWRVDTRPEAGGGECPIWVKAGTVTNPPLAPPDWDTVALERRPTDKDEITGVFRRR
jgi:4-amino-4-deoxy-L-arabinose transferase-like glycosyltransferase